MLETILPVSATDKLVGTVVNVSKVAVNPTPSTNLPKAAAPIAAKSGNGAAATPATPVAADSVPKAPVEKSRGDAARIAAAKAEKERLKALKAAEKEAAAAAGTSNELVNIAGGPILPPLAGGSEGNVVTRFPPEPSGYLHIGHCKALLLNDSYAKLYKGKMLLRFDDTNPSKEKEEFEENIMADLKSLNVEFASVSHTSDYFELLEKYARSMIEKGDAFMDDTPREKMQQERLARENSARRDSSIQENLARFEVMLKGGEEGSKWCLRAKMNMQDDNGTCRDPVLYRCNETPHHRTGTKFKAYPTYDFACPIVDCIEGVTHALRSAEYHDRDVQYYKLQDMMGLRRVVIQDFSRLNFIYTLLSKRKLGKLVDMGRVEGWNDPRFPTVQGILRRGVILPALREFILLQGASRKDNEMEWDKFWAINKKHLDPVAPRFTASQTYTPLIPFVIKGAPNREFQTHPLHPKNADVGVKSVLYTPTILLDSVDALAIAAGEEVTLMRWGNAIARELIRDANGKLIRIEGELHLEGSVKTTEKKLTWLPDSPADLVSFTMSEFDFLIKTPSLDEEDDFEAALNPITRLDIPLLGEPAMRSLKAGDIIQIERRGFARVDRAYVSADRPGALFLIPDGRVRGLYNLNERTDGVKS
jgi:glutamyl-tRNA synthetase